MMKAKIYELAGDPAKASQLAEEGRNMDQQDRYLNNESVKFLFKNDKVY